MDGLDQPLREHEFPEMLTVSATAKPNPEVVYACRGHSFERLRHPQNAGKESEPAYVKKDLSAAPKQPGLGRTKH